MKKTSTETGLHSIILASVMIMFILFSIGFASAWSINPFADTKYFETKKSQIENSFIADTFNSDYGVVQFSKTFLWIETDKIAEYSLIKSEDSIINAFAYGKATLYSNGKLFDDANFKDEYGNLKSLRDVQYFILTDTIIEVPTYKQECGYKRDSLIKKGEVEEYCVDVQTGFDKRTEKIWKPYNFEELKAGNYEWKLEAKKQKPNQKIDFIPIAQGKEMNEWVWWDESWAYKKQITLTETNFANRVKDVIELNLTGLKLSTSNCSKEIRITVGLDEVASQITDSGGEGLSSGSQWCKVLFLANATQNTAINYSVYYGNAGADVPTYTKTTFNQTTCPLTFNTGYFAGTMATEMGAINLLTTTGGIKMNFSAERFGSTTQGAWATCSVIENGNVRSKINVTQSDEWNIITLYQNAEKFNVTIQYTSAKMYLSSNYVALTTECGNESNVITCTTTAQRTVSEKWFAGNDSTSVVYTGWNNLSAFYDSGGRWVWWYDGANKGDSSFNLYYGASNQTNGWAYGRLQYLASLNPLTNSLQAEEEVAIDTNPSVTLVSPDDAFSSNTNANTFVCSATDDFKVQNISFYINNSINATNTSVYNNTETSFVASLNEGYYTWTCGAWDNQTGTPQYANATVRGITINLDSPVVTLNSPINAYNSTSQTVDFNCLVTDSVHLENVSLYLNSILNETNTSGFNNSNYTFTKTFAEGNYNWSCNAWNNNSKSTTAGYRTFSVNTQPIINVFSPVYNASILPTNTVYLNATSSLEVDEWIYNYNGTNYTLPSINSSITVSDGIYRLFLYGRNSATGIYGLNNSVYFRTHTTAPSIFISAGNETQNYWNMLTNNTLNYTVVAGSLGSCWLSYNGTNRTIPCTSDAINTTNFTVQFGLYNGTLWANDSFGGINNVSFTWNYRLIFISETYNSSVLEGSTQVFSTLLITNGTDITISNLSYNGTGYLGTIAQTGNNFTLTRSLATPTVTANTNMSFFWKVTQADGFVYNYTAKNQLLNNLVLDNCTINGKVLYNFTLLDEKLQTEINETGGNSLAEINLQLYAYGTTTQILSFNSKENQTNPFAVCFNNTFADEKYNLDAQVRYVADTYESEYYHIQNATINSASFPTNINLYDLNTSNSQVFKLIYKDSSLLPVYNALIVIGRKYVDEGTFKNVEIPKTDAYGETVAHLELNNVIYNFTIIKNNVILGTFENMFAVCQTPLVSECTIEFNSFAGAVGVPNFDTEGDFEYALGYIRATRTVQSNFTLPSGTPATVLLRVEKSDALGTDICTDTLTSASGTLSCVVPASIGNSTIIATLYKNGYYKSWGSLKINQTPTDIYGTSIMVFLSIVILLTLGGIALSGNPIITVVLLMVGVILMFALNLVANNGFIGGTATILFFVIACILLLIKGVKR